MQAIILAAGMGRRLGEFTSQNTKCMVEVNGMRLIDRMLLQLSQLDFSKIVIVTGYEGKKLRDYIETNYSNLNLVFVENKIYDKTNNIYSLWLAKDYLIQEDTILLESDLIFDDQVLLSVVKSCFENCALVAKYEPWMDGTMVKIDDDFNIVNFIPQEGFDYNETSSYYKTVNIYKFSKDFLLNKYLPFLEAYIRVLGENEYYEQVLRVITLIDGAGIQAIPLNGLRWYEIDDVQDLRIAETIFASPIDRLDKLEESSGGYWRFPNLIDFSNPSNPFFPKKKMIDELIANFSTKLRAYPSGNNTLSLLGAKYCGVQQKYVVTGHCKEQLLDIYIRNQPGNIGICSTLFENLSCKKYKYEIIPYLFTGNDNEFDADQMTTFFNDKEIKTLILTNPDAVTGRLIEHNEIQKIISWTSLHDINLVIDETLINFSSANNSVRFLSNSYLTKYPNLIILKDIAVEAGVPGLGLSIIASSQTDLISQIIKELPIHNIDSLSEFYLQICGKYEKDFIHSCSLLKEEREFLTKEIQKIPYLKVFPSEANFILCEVTENITSRDVCLALLDNYDILVKDIYPNKLHDSRQFIQIAVRNRQDNKKLIEALTGIPRQN